MSVASGLEMDLVDAKRQERVAAVMDCSATLAMTEV